MTNPEPNPGVWADGYSATSCWDCQKLGLDFNHDWVKCKESRGITPKRRWSSKEKTAEATGAAEPQADGNTRVVNMVSAVSRTSIRLEPEWDRVRDLRCNLNVMMRLSSGPLRKITVLIDTGSEVNLIRPGIVEPEHLQVRNRPVTIATASRGILQGGDKEVICLLEIMGVERDTKLEKTLEIPTRFIEAGISVDAILSYEWLSTFDFMVNPGMHGLIKRVPDTGDILFFPAIRMLRREVANVVRVDTPTLQPARPSRPEKKAARKPSVPRPLKKKRMLDLFSGTGSVGEAFKAMGFEVFSVDIDPRNSPTITVDVTVWQYWKTFLPQFFDVVACCPPCTEFSRAMTSRPRDLSKADKIVKAALEVIGYLQPTFWFMENPRHGELANREYMQSLAYIDVDYCMFSDWGYRKPTRIWGCNSIKRLHHQICEKKCKNMEWQTAEDGTSKWVHRSKLGCTPMPGKTKPTGVQAGRFPESLVHYLLMAEPSLLPPREGAESTVESTAASESASTAVDGPGPRSQAPQGGGGMAQHIQP